MRIQGPREPIPKDSVGRSDAAERDAKTAKSNGQGMTPLSESPKGDVVTLGSTARTLSAGGDSGLEPEIRARLDKVREQLKSNEYAIDFKKLASNILGDEIARSGEAE